MLLSGRSESVVLPGAAEIVPTMLNFNVTVYDSEAPRVGDLAEAARYFYVRQYTRISDTVHTPLRVH